MGVTPDDEGAGMADATGAVVILTIATVVLFALLLGCVWLATRPQHRD